MAAAVYLRKVVSLAGRFPLLSGVSLDIDDGEVVHLRGPNGAGKTSLLRLLAGLAPISSGSAIVLGHDLSRDRVEVRREVGLLGHEGFLYDDLSVEANINFALRAARVRTDRVEAALSRLSLSGRLRSTKVAKLSTGQRRRTALAILYARAPRLWLLDEPHAGLDQSARAVLDELIEEARAAYATVVLCSHELEAAGALADRVVELGGGRVLAQETCPRQRQPLERDQVVDPVGLAPTSPDPVAAKAGSDVA